MRYQKTKIIFRDDTYGKIALSIKPDLALVKTDLSADAIERALKAFDDTNTFVFYSCEEEAPHKRTTKKAFTVNGVEYKGLSGTISFNPGDWSSFYFVVDATSAASQKKRLTKTSKGQVKIDLSDRVAKLALKNRVYLIYNTKKSYLDNMKARLNNIHKETKSLLAFLHNMEKDKVSSSSPQPNWDGLG